MSHSHSDELFLVKGLDRKAMKSSYSMPATPVSDLGLPENQKEEEEEGNDQKEEGNCEKTAAASASHYDDKPDFAQDDDGFRTPTGEEHRIPVPRRCPPAPRPRRFLQLNSPQRKRITASSKARRRLTMGLDPWKELLDSVFPSSAPPPPPPWFCTDDGNEDGGAREAKRTRTDKNNIE